MLPYSLAAAKNNWKKKGGGEAFSLTALHNFIQEILLIMAVTTRAYKAKSRGNYLIIEKLT